MMVTLTWGLWRTTITTNPIFGSRRVDLLGLLLRLSHTTVFQIISNELESLVCEEEPENTDPRCYLCNLGLKECLLKCKHCGDYLCHTGPYPPSQTAPCVILQVFRDEANVPPVQDEVDNFSCVHCWNHAEQGTYPVRIA